MPLARSVCQMAAVPGARALTSTRNVLGCVLGCGVWEVGRWRRLSSGTGVYCTDEFVTRASRWNMPARKPRARSYAGESYE